MDILALYDIDLILPQHGSIINRDIARYIDALKTLECGSLLAPVKKDLLQSGGFTMIFREVYQRIASLYPPEDVKEVFDAVPALQFDENNEITGYRQDGNEVWNQIFNEIRDRKGMIWLGVLFPFVEKLSVAYDLVMPAVFNSSFHEIVNENQRLIEINQALDQTIRSANDRLVRCQITSLYNETFFRSLMIEELEREDWRDLGSLVCIGVDDFAAYQLQYGIQEERTVLNNMAYMLKEEFGANTVYRLDFTEFALYLKGLSKTDLIEKMDRFRVRVSESDFFLGDLTICAGLAFPDEIELDSPSYDTTLSRYQDLAFERLRAARVSGRNKICYEGRQEQARPQKGKVLVVDTDVTNLTLIKTFLEETGIEVLTADNGIDARDLAASQHPNVIVSEIMLNKLDGFGLRGELLKNSSTMDIETIFLSYKKDDESVERAIKLGVTHYLRKPYLLSELLGIVNRYVRGAVR